MMRFRLRLAVLACSAALMSGCVAAIIPVAAAGAIGRSRHANRQKGVAPVVAEAPSRVPVPVPTAARVPTGAPVPTAAPVPIVVAALPAPASPPSAAPPLALVDGVPPGMQYLYGSGEASAIALQSWHGMVAYVAGVVQGKRPIDSVVLVPGSTLDKPSFVPCGDKPLAVVLDVDETVLLNLGAQYDAVLHPGPFDPRRWEAWERTGADKVTATPGAVRALGQFRFAEVAVVFNTNRNAANAAGTEAALNGAGVGPAKHGETLFMTGDDATGSRKDGRRATIAARYCVIAMAGDQLGDFSDLFNAGVSPAARRAQTMAPAVNGLWGAGWFVQPNPVYGTAIRGGIDDVFPKDKRWTPPSSISRNK